MGPGKAACQLWVGMKPDLLVQSGLMLKCLAFAWAGPHYRPGNPSQKIAQHAKAHRDTTHMMQLGHLNTKEQEACTCRRPAQAGALQHPGRNVG